MMTQPGTFDPLPQPDAAVLAISDVVAAAEFPEHRLRWRNDRAAALVGLSSIDDAAWVRHFGAFEPLPGAQARPLALRYHGHQFGMYNPDLGDGRGFLFAQLRDGDGRLLDLGTKGSGTTPYSRFGDGRLTLKGAVREALATEMLTALGVETSQTFSIIETGEALHRGDEPSPTRSAVLLRLSHSHLRIGTFQRLAALEDRDAMTALLRHALNAYHAVAGADAQAMSADAAARMLLDGCVTRFARLAASYMVAGFVHGVLNTDNINITGESFDYGPWRFTPQFDPGFVAAYFDQAGRYAFGRQPETLFWNTGQLALALSLLAPAEALLPALDRFADAYADAMADRFCWRLGVTRGTTAQDRALVVAAERLMRGQHAGIDAFFASWAGGASGIAADTAEGTALQAALAGRQALRGMHWPDHIPPQSMHIEEVEAIWSAIAERDDWQPFHDKVGAIRQMGAMLANISVQ